MKNVQEFHLIWKIKGKILNPPFKSDCPMHKSTSCPTFVYKNNRFIFMLRLLNHHYNSVYFYTSNTTITHKHIYINTRSHKTPYHLPIWNAIQPNFFLFCWKKLKKYQSQKVHSWSNCMIFLSFAAFFCKIKPNNKKKLNRNYYKNPPNHKTRKHTQIHTHTRARSLNSRFQTTKTGYQIVNIA